MYINRLDICGFKSFVDKTTFLFSSGISAVVGPNGCGKSNVIDAVQWVMGEQSVKQLRGKLKEDVIFAGAEETQPTNMAEVVMTLTNTNGHLPEEYQSLPEISIGRRLFRSGESRYYINKRSCRLKDIHNIFFGTGAGTKAYSIIQQGRIGAIIEASPEELRYFIEEAAGTTRYKNQKQESLRKIEKTRQNLLRVTDIIGEIKRQRNALRRQARKAERFREIRDSIREMDILLSVHEHGQVVEQLNEGDNLLTSLKDDDSQHSATLTRLDAAVEQIKWERVQKEKALSEERNRLHDCQRAIDKAENNLLYYQKDIERLDRQTVHLREEREEIAAKDHELAEELWELEESVSLLETDIEKKMSALEKEEKRVEQLKKDTDLTRRSLEKEKSELVTLLTREAQYKNTHHHAARNKASLNQRLIRAQNEAKRAESLSFELEKRVCDSKQNLERVGAAADKLKEKAGVLKAECERLRTGLSKKVKDVQTLTAQFNEARSRYKALRRMDENYEWLKGGARAIMRRHNSANGQDGICGLVADIIEPEPSFELAVEAALGEALQHVIVKTQEQGIEATGYLADQGSGRGSFIPVNTYRPLADMIHLSEGNNEKKQVDLLLDHVGAKDRYETLTRQLLGNTIVAQDLTDALSLWNRNGSFRTIVTKDGDCVSCEGIITGGNSREAQTSILAKKREVKTLGELVSGMGTQLEAAKAEQEEMEALTCAVESEQQEVSKRLRQKESEYVDAEKTLYKLEEDLRHQNRHLEIARLEVEQLNGEETDLDREISECDKLLSRISEDVSAFNERIAVSQSQMQKESDEIEVSSQKLMDIRLELTSLKAKKENTINDLRRLRLFQNDSAERMHQLRKEIEDAERDIEAQKTKIETGKNQLKKDYADLKCIEMTLSENEESFRKIDNKLTENDRIIVEIETVQKKTLQKMQQLELKQSEQRLRLQHLSSRIDERYHQDLTALAVSTNIEDMNVAEKETELAAMREKMVRLGDVNLAAIEEFETLNERLDFYNAQYEDLEKGIENLKQVIARINTTTKRKFLKTFAAVNEKFNTVFPTLFEGGTANLELTDLHNPLESGVVILVHPPGKKVLRMSLLSGGEKALAALALIFSIYLIKPSPFCLLDEIDAPLDDVNVDRFTELMKRIAEHSQVIIVTHNKRSMAISDNLFGVTMGKKGVSQVVSVKLKDSTPP